MAGAQFEYDEKGTTFYYFLISFFGIVLVPVTYYVWKVTKLPGKAKIPPVAQKVNKFSSVSNSAGYFSWRLYISYICFVVLTRFFEKLYFR